MENTIEKRLRDVLEANVELSVPINEITLDQELETLGINSISFIKLIVAVEAEFDIEVDDENLEYSNFRTLSVFINYIESQMAMQ